VLPKPIRQSNLSRAILKALGAPAPACPEAGQPRAGAGAGLASVGPPRFRPSLRILLAEDNPVNQKLAIALLCKEGHKVVPASNGHEALAALQREPFDVVLMDVQMPEMDGLEAAAAIREKEKGTGRHLPILAMTAYAMKGDRERCLAAGMDGYVAKPINRTELLEAIARTCSGHPEDDPRRLGPPERPAGQDEDWSEALAEAGGDWQLLAETAALFLEECPRWLAALRSALDERDRDKVQFTAHTFKSGLTALVLKEAFEAAFLLEAVGRQGRTDRDDWAAAEQAWAALLKAVDRVTPALAALAAQAYIEERTR
jgi:CheY-like chemotaxis protein